MGWARFKAGVREWEDPRRDDERYDDDDDDDEDDAKGGRTMGTNREVVHRSPLWSAMRASRIAGGAPPGARKSSSRGQWRFGTYLSSSSCWLGTTTHASFLFPGP